MTQLGYGIVSLDVVGGLVKMRMQIVTTQENVKNIHDPVL